MIRLARLSDCAALPTVQKDSAQPFRDIGMADVADAKPPAADVYPPHVSAQTLWVAADDDDRPAGFCLCAAHAPFLYVDELAVTHAYQRRGLGRALMQAAIAAGRERGFRGMALRTFKTVPWNAPFYASLGFVIEDPPELTALTSRTVAHEMESHLDPDSRCTMTLRF